MTGPVGTSAPGATLVVKAWPGQRTWRPPAPAPERGGSLVRDRYLLTLAARPARGVVPQRLGLAGATLSLGRQVIGRWMAHDDDLDAGARAELAAWGASVGVEVLGLRAFNRAPVLHHAYWGASRRPEHCTLVAGADLGVTLGLLAERWWPARVPGARDGWGLGLAGWGWYGPNAEGTRESWHRDTGRPVVYVAAQGGLGLRAFFGTPRASFEGERRGCWVPASTGRMRAYRGHFVELLAAGFTFDGLDADDLDEHLVAWDLTSAGLPVAVEPGPEHARAILAHLDGARQLALRLDDEADGWSTTLEGLVSPGTLAARELGRRGARPPLGRYRLGDDELGAWTAAFHGGLSWAEPGRYDGAADVDIRSAYPTCWRLLGCWRHFTAKELRPKDVTAAFARFLTAPDLAGRLRSPGPWARWGATLVEVVLTGHRVPLTLDLGGGSTRLALRDATGRARLPWADVAAAALYAVAEGRPLPEVVGAVHLLPVGRLDGAQEVDPVAELIGRRQAAKADGSQREAAALRLLGNAMSFGQPARFDPPGTGERPGPWCWPPAAASVTAGTRLLLAMLGTEVEAQGGRLPYADTDGAVVVGLDDGQLAEVLAGFDPLDGLGGGLWAVKTRGRATIFGNKRTLVQGADGEPLAWTEAVIGAYVPPPGAGERGGPDGRYRWVADGAVAMAAGLAMPVMDRVVPRLSWEPDGDEEPGFPALQRRQAATRRTLAEGWAGAVSLRPFARFVLGLRLYETGPALTALDPGGDLAGWADLDWRDAGMGAPVAVTTPSAWVRHSSVVLRSLRGEMAHWADLHGLDHDADAGPAAVLLDRVLVTTAAGLDDETGQLVPRALDAGAVLVAAARVAGTAWLARATGLPERSIRSWVAGRKAPRADSVARALVGIGGAGELAGLLDAAHAGRALTVRQRRCRYCAAVVAGDLTGPCPLCSDRPPVTVTTTACPGCGAERVGDLSGPCPFCARADRSGASTVADRGGHFRPGDLDKPCATCARETHNKGSMTR